MDTNTALDTFFTLASLGGIAAALGVLMERSHRRERREHGARTTWTWTRYDADSRRIANEIHSLDGAAHR